MIKQAVLEAISIRHRGRTRNYVAVLSVDQRGLETPVGVFVREKHINGYT